MVYILGRDGRICSVRTGNKCASGTGEFYVQQLRRIGLTLEDAVRFSRDDKPYLVSGRCSVFCKSDCTHATNKGVPRERIAAGLSKMMAGKILEITKPLAGKRLCDRWNRSKFGHGRLFEGGVSRGGHPVGSLYFEALGSALGPFAMRQNRFGMYEICSAARPAHFSCFRPLRHRLTASISEPQPRALLKGVIAVSWCWTWVPRRPRRSSSG